MEVRRLLPLTAWMQSARFHFARWRRDLTVPSVHISLCDQGACKWLRRCAAHIASFGACMLGSVCLHELLYDGRIEAQFTMRYNSSWTNGRGQTGG